ncbi:flavo protein [Amniculicola lignicola CBS 123094]|uniref:Flavo protein n=1 Tax=Amniculicola lignicola CBS 123094 TaxID=1392246 RepID=A0A6A5WW48_9PLEO|nr:flavo protein [Amniculicola lignicola CBS 123094]
MAALLQDLQPVNLQPVQSEPCDLPPQDGKIHLLLCATGSVATIKIPNIVEAFSKHNNVSIRLIFTECAKNFLQGQSSEQPSLQTIGDSPNVDGIYFDEDEWRDPWVQGNKILHIELRRWDIMVVAPLSANTLAKITQGWSDNLLLSVVRAWDTTGQLDPICDTPGLNRYHDDWGVQNGGWFEVLQPMEKELACGDVGGGAMKDWREIVAVIENRLGLTSGMIV